MIKAFIFILAAIFPNITQANEPISVDFTREHGKPALIVTWEKCIKVVQIDEKDLASGDADKIVHDIKSRVKCDAR